MKPWRSKVLLLSGAAALAAAIPAFSQQAPQSLLPPGFEDPAPANTNAPAQAPPAAPAAIAGAGKQSSVRHAAQPAASRLLSGR